MTPQATAPTSYRVRPFRPARWLPGAHAQTLGGRVARPDPGLELHRERLETPDGDFLDLDFAPAPSENAPIVLLLHGLEGCARTGYALVTYRELAARGIRGVGLNFRSCSGEPNHAARFYHSGETGDVRFVLAWLAERFPDAPRGAVGFSLGGNVLLKFLAEEGDDARRRLAAAAAVSVPFDLAAGARALEEGVMGRIYTSYFLRSLRRKVAAKAELLGPRCELERVRGARTLRTFDDAVTAPLHGFEDAGDYYRRSSSGPLLDRIRTPTLLLQSEDDPFLPAAAIPREAVERNPWIVPGFTEHGGHVGFVGGPPWAPQFWAEEEAARFLGAVLGAATAERRTESP